MNKETLFSELQQEDNYTSIAAKFMALVTDTEFGLRELELFKQYINNYLALNANDKEWLIDKIISINSLTN